MRFPLAGSASAAEVADVRNALLLVDDQVVDDVEVLGVLLREQRLRRAAIVAAVVHVHVQVGAHELSEVRGEVVVLEADRHLDAFACREFLRTCDMQTAEAALHLDRRLARREFDLAA